MWEVRSRLGKNRQNIRISSKCQYHVLADSTVPRYFKAWVVVFPAMHPEVTCGRHTEVHGIGILVLSDSLTLLFRGLPEKGRNDDVITPPPMSRSQLVNSSGP